MTQGVHRRRFLALAGGGVVAVPTAGVLAGVLAGCGGPSAPSGHRAGDPFPITPPPAGPKAAGTPSATAPTVPVTVSTGAPFRPPASPLAVRSPYLHAWLPADRLPGTWAIRWNGQQTQLAGMVAVDGHPWVWAGDPAVAGVTLPKMTQTAMDVTPTRSVFTLEGGGIRLRAEFLSPIEPGDVRWQSAPLALVSVTAEAADGAEHDVTVYADISGQWASGTTTEPIVWTCTATAATRTWAVSLATQKAYVEYNQMAAWGELLWASPVSAGLSYQSGADTVVRGRFARSGSLASTVDLRFPRPVDDDPPVFAFCHDLGKVGKAGAGASFVLGQVRPQVIDWSMDNIALAPAWMQHWASSASMVDDFLAGAEGARRRAAALDRKIIDAATARAGAGYAQLCTLAALQAYGACELVTGPEGQTWAFLKEISSGAGTSTVDTITSASPIWLYLDPGFFRLLLDPILSYAASPAWTAPWAPHDLGYFYPTARGHDSLKTSEQMPVQETGGLLSLAEAYAQKVDRATGNAFLATYEKLWSGWSDWLVGQLPSPPTQLTADDFLNSLDHSVNLALLGIVGLGAAGKIFARLGKHAASQHWTRRARALIARWEKLSMDKTGQHLNLTQGGKGTWGTAYNAYLDRLIGTNLVSAHVSATQAAWYKKKMQRYGLPFESPVPHWARADWEAWTAAWLRHYPVGRQLIDKMVDYVNHTPERVPYSDTYWTTTGRQVLVWPVFDQARPGVGAMYALLALLD